MPSSQTPNYQLNQWVKSDKVLMEDFNADNAKIDAAIKAVDAKADALLENKADKSVAASLAALQSTVSSLQSTVAGKQDSSSAVKFVVGSYTGDGNTSRSISLGFTPRAVIVWAKIGLGVPGWSDTAYQYGGLAVTGSSMTTKAGDTILSIQSNGFRVYCKTTVLNNIHYRAYTNEEGTGYNYLALA